MQYSIADLEQLSGVSVHNIRIWERRYNALQPARSAGNTRSYDDGQLRRLLGIIALQHAGYKISGACSLSTDAMNMLLQQQIDRARPANHRHEFYISQIIRHALVYQESEINGLISLCFEQFGVLQTYKQIVYPMLTRVGLLWLSTSVCPSQEHFLSAIIRQKLFAAIDQYAAPTDLTAPHWLLFLPEDEDHDIGLLLASYLLRTAGYRVTYLGARLPLPALAEAVKTLKPDRLLFFMSRMRTATVAQNYIEQVLLTAGGGQVYLSGSPKLLTGLHYPAGCSWLKNLEDFENLFNAPNS